MKPKDQAGKNPFRVEIDLTVPLSQWNSTGQPRAPGRPCHGDANI